MKVNPHSLKIVTLLKKNYPNAHCSLNYKTPFQLLVATVLSAQCTDDRVNMVTPKLFERFPTAKDMSKATIKELEELIRSTGFYKNKALALKSLSETLHTQFNDELPKDIESLTKLRGVGRKTANVVLGNAFNIASGIVVDTHVGRISRRLGFTKEKNPEKVERELNKIIPKKDWVVYSHLLIEHGRKICSARFKPKCDECFLSKLCERRI